MLARVGALIRLLRWLGPWTAETRVPASVDFKDIDVQGEQFGGRFSRIRLFWSTKRPIRGALYVMPGVHHLGASDPRMSRLCSVLADAGIVVGAPFIPDLVALRLTEQSVADTISSVETFLDLKEIPAGIQPGLFCISTASILGVHAAAEPRLQDRLGGMVVFGGFADWQRSMRFMLTGRLANGETTEPDPLNRSVVFLNMIPWLDGVPSNPEPLASLWTEFIHQTWEQPSMEKPEKYQAVARTLSDEANPEWQTLFELGVGLRSGAVPVLEDALERWKQGAVQWLDPSAKMAEIRCPVAIVHGRDDRVIPWTEAQALQEMLPADRHLGTWVTGFYDHTGHTGWMHLIVRLPLLPFELWRSIRILWSFIRVAGFTRV